MTTVKTFGNIIKNSMTMLRRNKNTIKNIAYGVQKKYLKTRHNFASKSVKYLGEEAIKKFRHTAPQAAKGGKQLFSLEAKKNSQVSGKQLGPLVNRSVEYMRGKELSSLINMVSKSKPQLPFLAGGGLMRLTEFNFFFSRKKVVVPKDDIPKDYIPKDDIPKDVVPKDVVPKDVVPKDVVPKNDVPKDDISIEGHEAFLKDPTQISKLDLKKKNEITLDNGEIYEGNLVNGKPDGKGKLTYPDGGDVYEGNFINGKMQGAGQINFVNGDVYKGPFLDTKPHGDGYLNYKNGDSYEGGFANAMFHGRGIQITHHKDLGEIVRMSDNFVNGKIQGRGGYSEQKGMIYQGDHVDNKFEGNGKAIWPNDDEYSGEWKNNKRHGQGEYIATNGDWYNGKWENGFYLKGQNDFKQKPSFCSPEGLWEDEQDCLKHITPNDSSFPLLDRLNAWVYKYGKIFETKARAKEAEIEAKMYDKDSLG